MPTATPEPAATGAADGVLFLELVVIGLVAAAFIALLAVAWAKCKGEDLGKLIEKLKFHPIRLNILLISAFVWIVCLGIITLIGIAVTRGTGDDNNQFVIGALVGLLGSGITALAGLGTTLLNEGSERSSRPCEPLPQTPKSEDQTRHNDAGGC